MARQGFYGYTPDKIAAPSLSRQNSRVIDVLGGVQDRLAKERAADEAQKRYDDKVALEQKRFDIGQADKIAEQAKKQATGEQAIALGRLKGADRDEYLKNLENTSGGLDFAELSKIDRDLDFRESQAESQKKRDELATKRFNLTQQQFNQTQADKRNAKAKAKKDEEAYNKLAEQLLNVSPTSSETVQVDTLINKDEVSSAMQKQDKSIQQYENEFARLKAIEDKKVADAAKTEAKGKYIIKPTQVPQYKGGPMVTVDRPFDAETGAPLSRFDIEGKELFDPTKLTTYTPRKEDDLRLEALNLSKVGDIVIPTPVYKKLDKVIETKKTTSEKTKELRKILADSEVAGKTKLALMERILPKGPTKEEREQLLEDEATVNIYKDKFGAENLKGKNIKQLEYEIERDDKRIDAMRKKANKKSGGGWILEATNTGLDTDTIPELQTLKDEYSVNDSTFKAIISNAYKTSSLANPIGAAYWDRSHISEIKTALQALKEGKELTDKLRKAEQAAK